MCLGDFNQDSVFSHQLKLDQSQTFEEMASFYFKKIEIDCEYKLVPQLCDSASVFEFILTPVSLPNLDPFSESTLIFVLIELEIEPPIFDSHIP